MAENKNFLLELAEDARAKASELEEQQDDKEDLDENFYFMSGQITAYNAIAEVLERLGKEQL